MSSALSPTIVVALLALAVAASVALTLLTTGRRRAAAAAREAELRAQLAGSSAAARTEAQMLEAFRAMAGQAMAEQSQQLTTLADGKYQQLHGAAQASWESQAKVVLSKLGDYERALQQLDLGRQGDSSALLQAVQDLRSASEQSRQEAARLATALSDTRARGSWGELQLRRVLEVAGMTEHVDFVEQTGVSSEKGSARPDVVVRLPNGRAVVIDAKAPLNSFLEASEQDDPAARRRLLAAHGKAVLDHATALRKRDYSDKVDGAVDLVVMFIPGEAFLAAAYEAQPTLLEDGLAHDVLIASPTSLMGLLRAIAHGWREERMAEQAEHIATLGRELHDRIGLVLERVARTGAALDKAVEAHNATIGSVEARLLPTARKLEDMQARSSRELPAAEPITRTVRQVTAEVVRPADDRSGGPARDAEAVEAGQATGRAGEGTDAVRELRPASAG